MIPAQNASSDAVTQGRSGTAVERGNLPNNERRCESRPWADNDSRAITPPLRLEWLLIPQGLQEPQTSTTTIPQRYADGYGCMRGDTGAERIE